jgi:hypothetical protein
MNAPNREAAEIADIQRIQETAVQLARSDSPIVVDTATLIEALSYNLLRHLGEGAEPLLLGGTGGRADG